MAPSSTRNKVPAQVASTGARMPRARSRRHVASTPRAAISGARPR
ncbi:MAG: hypothetical protein MAG471_01295 [Acidimicrobiaceae bacterium]|nr:hypothetical protein [Acidimicrobiaceae bacterium]